jgi:hypothetical protein
MRPDDDTDLEVSRPDEISSDTYKHWSLDPWGSQLAARVARTPGRRGIATAVLVLVALVCVLTSIPGGWQSLAAALHLESAFSTAAAAPAESFVSLEDGVPWGRLAIDGRRVTGTQVIQRYTGFEQAGTLLELAPGRHMIEYSAPPFGRLHCWLSVPRTASDSCPLVPAVDPAAPRVRALDLGASLGRLAPAARSALEAAIALGISDGTSSVLVSPGERMRLASGISQVASASLAASLSYGRIMGATGQASDSAESALHSCVSLCRIGSDAYVGVAAGQSLALLAAVSLEWRYTPAIGGLSFDGAAAPPQQPTIGLLRLDVQWDGTWRAALAQGPVGSAPCSVGVGLLSAANASLATSGTFGLVPAPQDAAGCLLLWRSCDDPAALCPFGTPVAPAEATPTSGAATFVYRFGLLFAADAAAHALVPELPAPNAAEHAAVLRVWGAAAAG